MTTYSHSKLSTFEQCRLKYKFAYIDWNETGKDLKLTDAGRIAGL